MKRVLILVLSTEQQFYKKLLQTSMATWDLLSVENVETIFYCGRMNTKADTDKIIYINVEDSFFNMGYKHLAAFEYALKNREFDFVYNVGASMYVNKEKLLNYVQNKPPEYLAIGLVTPTTFYNKTFMYLWGGGGYLLSKDVVQKVVDNKEKWNHRMMEDQAISYLLNELQIPMISTGVASSIHIKESGYEIITYENGVNGGCVLSNLNYISTNLPNQFAFRVKDDSDRENDIRLMNELYKAFNNV